MTPCLDTISRRVVSVRLLIPITDLPAGLVCEWKPGHAGAHGTHAAGYRIWWWRRGNDRLQLRGKAIDV